MIAQTTIREERPGDEDAIRALTAAAFENAPHASGTEARIVDALRRDGDLALSLVAEADGSIVGHVAFSPVRIDGQDGAFGLGPVSVVPDHQRRGIGRALIEEGLARLTDRRALACVLIGDPGYYARFGFRAGALTCRDVPLAYVQGTALSGPPPRGEIAYAPGFDAA